MQVGVNSKLLFALEPGPYHYDFRAHESTAFVIPPSDLIWNTKEDVPSVKGKTIIKYFYIYVIFCELFPCFRKKKFSDIYRYFFSLSDILGLKSTGDLISLNF